MKLEPILFSGIDGTDWRVEGRRVEYIGVPAVKCGIHLNNNCLM